MASTTSPLQQPVNRLTVETAILANGTSLISLLGYIIEKTNEICRFKEDCIKLVNMCIALSLSFTENQATLAQMRSGQDFFECLQTLLLLVTQCSQQWTIRHIGWEVFIQRRLEGLQKRLERCQQVFNTEILVSFRFYNYGNYSRSFSQFTKSL
jgi:hypothetical protein